MSEADKITAEGATLAEAQANAAAALGISVDEVRVEYDREHLASGASTVRIFASRREAGARPQGEGGPRKPARNPRRDEVIRNRGRRAAEEVLDGRAESIVVDLNSYERHLVHTVVREFEGLTSGSIGEGLRKDVVVTMGEPEDEDEGEQE